MATVDRTPAEVESDLAAFAKEHRLMLPNGSCLKAHIERYLTVGHCPCVETRDSCPCDEALSDVEEMGRCECGILIDPARLYALRNQEGNP
ncbi:MAG: hypothetical protein JXA58_03275 [Dehalococcoidia bacterium]|nr:hypothetical protein [Dehalococcoidia bacterium]